MIAWLKNLDDLLRGNKTTPERLAEGTRHIELKPLIGIGVVLGILYGVFMGLFAVASRTPACPEQLLATAVKVPALFFLTLLVTFPSLYVFSALLGVRLGPADTLRLLVAAIAVNLAVLASFGPITGFFVLSTTSYYFIKLLNVAFFAVAGTIGLGFLMRALNRLEAAQVASEAEEGEEKVPSIDALVEDSPAKPGVPVAQVAPWPSPLPRPSTARRVFRVWVVLYALVGAQMGWILRPFIGAPDLPFVLFRGRQDWILVDVLQAIGKLLSSR